MNADEPNTDERREGMHGSIFWWVAKLGMAAALAGGGFLLNASGVAIWAIYTFSITEEKAHEVRTALEARRGAPGAAMTQPA